MIEVAPVSQLLLPDQTSPSPLFAKKRKLYRDASLTTWQKFWSKRGFYQDKVQREDHARASYLASLGDFLIRIGVERGVVKSSLTPQRDITKFEQVAEIESYFQILQKPVNNFLTSQAVKNLSRSQFTNIDGAFKQAVILLENIQINLNSHQEVSFQELDSAKIALNKVAKHFSELTPRRFNLETAIQDDKAMQDFEPESHALGVEHSQKVKATPNACDSGSKTQIDLSSSIAVSRFKKPAKKPSGCFHRMQNFFSVVKRHFRRQNITATLHKAAHVAQANRATVFSWKTVFTNLENQAYDQLLKAEPSRRKNWQNLHREIAAQNEKFIPKDVITESQLCQFRKSYQTVAAHFEFLQKAYAQLDFSAKLQKEKLLNSKLVADLDSAQKAFIEVIEKEIAKTPTTQSLEEYTKRSKAHIDQFREKLESFSIN